MKYFYELITTDGEVKYIPPQAAEAINRAMAQGKEHIGTTEKIRVRDIKRFRESDKPYYDGPLIESGLPVENEGAFGPVETEEGVVVVGVKKRIPIRKLFQYKGVYKVLEQDENYATVGFWVPRHTFNNRLQLCSPSELKLLN